jgi:hypothetical protein
MGESLRALGKSLETMGESLRALGNSLETIGESQGLWVNPWKQWGNP